MEPCSQVSRYPDANPVHHGVSGGAAISPAYPTRNLGITSIYLEGIDKREIVDTSWSTNSQEMSFNDRTTLTNRLSRGVPPDSSLSLRPRLLGT